MAYTAIPSSLIQVGKALKQTLFQLLKDDLDDHESRLSSVESGTSKIEVFNSFVYNSQASVATGVAMYRCVDTFTLNDAKLAIFDVSGATFTSGTIEFDIQKSTSADFTSSVSVFTTKPSLAYTASSFDESSNAVFDVANADVEPGDYLRLDITSFFVGDTLSNFQVILYGEI